MSKALIALMKVQSWERAKAELNIMLNTFYPEYELGTGDKIPNGYEDFRAAVNEFVEKVEDNGWHE